VRDLEKQLAQLDKDDGEPDPEDVMRGAAAVKVQDTDESKFLGPSSGITITRLVMQLAKQFTDSKSISEIVPDARARTIKAAFDQEDARPTSKVYPLVSDVAAEELPNRDLTNLLVELFYCKGGFLTAADCRGTNNCSPCHVSCLSRADLYPGCRRRIQRVD
jgi:hypothetical protein